MLLKLIYKQVIDNKCTTDFEKAVWHEAYEEFCLQSQRYNAHGNLFTFRDMVANDGKANSLHYKVGFSVGLFIRNLHSLIPKAYDTLGHTQVKFEACEMQLISADTRNRKDFCLALLYTTPPLVLHGLAGNRFWVSLPANDPSAIWQQTMLIPMEPHISIGQVQPVSYQNAQFENNSLQAHA
ncbi:MAG: hypothetical protein MUF24_10465 [Chitinophagaceae bacterium]|jgi:hypothetical protein|nr:hypothetical protein [Chitinophagaceae bacterium]